MEWSQTDPTSLRQQEQLLKQNGINKNVHIIALQEATSKKHIRHWNLFKKDYDCFKNKKSINQMHTFIKKNSGLEVIKQAVIHGKFESGRVFSLIPIRQNNVVIVFGNCHPGKKISKSTTLAQSDLVKLRSGFDKLASRFEITRIIFSGDFNRNLNEIEIPRLNLTAYNIIPEDVRETQYTCCNDHRKYLSQGSAFENKYRFVDHILDSKPVSSSKYQFLLDLKIASKENERIF